MVGIVEEYTAVQRIRRCDRQYKAVRCATDGDGHDVPVPQRRQRHSTRRRETIESARAAIRAVSGESAVSRIAANHRKRLRIERDSDSGAHKARRQRDQTGKTRAFIRKNRRFSREKQYF